MNLTNFLNTFPKLRSIISSDLYKYLLLREKRTRGMCVSHEKMDKTLLEMLCVTRECEGRCRKRRKCVDQVFVRTSWQPREPLEGKIGSRRKSTNWLSGSNTESCDPKTSSISLLNNNSNNNSNRKVVPRARK